MAECDKIMQKELIGVGNQIRAYGILDGRLSQTRQLLTDMIMYEHDSEIKNAEERWTEFKERIKDLHDSYKKEQEELSARLSDTK